MRELVVDLYWGGGRGLDDIAVLSEVDTEVSEFRNVVSDRIFQADDTVVNQSHDRRCGDRLGHREKAKYRVPRHRVAAGDIAQTGLVIKYLSAGLVD